MHYASFHDEADMLGAASERLFADTCAPAVSRRARAGERPAAAWDAYARSGALDALLPEAAGGAGLGLGDVASTFLAAGYHAAPFPAADTVLARAWLAGIGATPPPGAIAIAPQGWRRDGDVLRGARVPWLRVADHVLASVDGQACLLPVSKADIAPTAPHGVLSASAGWAMRDAQMLSAEGAPALDTLAACGYAGIAAGAMVRVLHLSLAYAGERRQFGKQIGRFQAIQQQLAVMAEQVWAARGAADLVLTGPIACPRPEAAALAWGRICEAIVPVCDIAHAVHGAIGITEEHDLGLYTGSLREWRLALGSESAWYARVGADALASDLPALDLVRRLCGEAVA
ncbi:acyl-CoA dehydrogenase family protein [Achromobacter aloeverae]